MLKLNGTFLGENVQGNIESGEFVRQCFETGESGRIALSVLMVGYMYAVVLELYMCVHILMRPIFDFKIGSGISSIPIRQTYSSRPMFIHMVRRMYDVILCNSVMHDLHLDTKSAIMQLSIL